jgi:hypothetical protein
MTGMRVDFIMFMSAVGDYERLKAKELNAEKFYRQVSLA